jgi:hypothetical protein
MKSIIAFLAYWFEKIGQWAWNCLKFIGKKIISFFKRFSISAGWGDKDCYFILLGLRIMTKAEFGKFIVIEFDFLKAYFAIRFE